MRNHGRIVAQLQSVQQDLTSFLNEDMINQACHQAGHTWRKRILTPVVIFHWLLQQILLENTALKHVSLLANRSFTDSAYCQARQKLPLKVLKREEMANQRRGIIDRSLLQVSIPSAE